MTWLTCSCSTWLSTTMQPISLSKTQDVISHLIAGDSYRKIEMATGVFNSKIALIKQELCLDKENLIGGVLGSSPHKMRKGLSVLSSMGILRMLQMLLNTSTLLLTTLSLCKLWGISSKEPSWRPMSRKKSPSSKASIGRQDYSLLWSIGTGPRRTGRECYTQMRPKSIDLG